jgi:hypothetical protein
MGYCQNCVNFCNKGFVYCKQTKLILKWAWTGYENQCDWFKKRDWTLSEHAPSVFVEAKKIEQQLYELLARNLRGRSN